MADTPVVLATTSRSSAAGATAASALTHRRIRNTRCLSPLTLSRPPLRHPSEASATDEQRELGGRGETRCSRGSANSAARLEFVG